MAVSIVTSHSDAGGLSKPHPQCFSYVMPQTAAPREPRGAAASPALGLPGDAPGVLRLQLPWAPAHFSARGQSGTARVSATPAGTPTP